MPDRKATDQGGLLRTGHAKRPLSRTLFMTQDRFKWFWASPASGAVRREAGC